MTPTAPKGSARRWGSSPRGPGWTRTRRGPSTRHRRWPRRWPGCRENVVAAWRLRARHLPAPVAADHGGRGRGFGGAARLSSRRDVGRTAREGTHRLPWWPFRDHYPTRGLRRSSLRGAQHLLSANSRISVARVRAATEARVPALPLRVRANRSSLRVRG